MNVSIRAESQAAAGAVTQDEVIDLLRGLVTRLGRQRQLWAAGADVPPFLDVTVLMSLREIADHPGITVNELARRIGVPKSRVSNLVRRLATEGIVCKQSDADDARLVRLTITASGRARAEQWQSARKSALHEMLRGLSAEELAATGHGLRILLAVVPGAQPC